ncbi:MAG: NAD(P)/FAD-dependent oxidoreductase [Methanocellales archaeon]|nr:NAD(P)/FAD-dependent oxidoreductase [Methanocellales archaeon]MDD3291444.1 NAD(P)/FAD-dependent oxidoreductase [Methanocellales archaeon]MDD5234666.1 NAD(P)/FAD-dependent oxidoreductase [Methanocellales archaeon]MDD5484982.1 NAD(P)/FAD-dependent oxidoreductase [Methanocellales archaeon]
MKYDVVVVGAGPAGSLAAKYSAMSGAETLLIEEHPAIGHPVSCAGLISVKALDECEIGLGKWINNEIRGAFICSPDGQEIQIEGGEVKAYAIDRKMFDQELAKRAAKAGADVLIPAKATGLRKGENILEVTSQGELLEISAKIIIGADGVKSDIAKWSDLGKVKKILPGIQILGLYDANDPSFVEIFTGSVAPGFFAWAIPIEDTARIGLCTSRPFQHLTSMLKYHKVVSKRYKGSYLDLMMGAIPLGPLERTISKGIMIVGDAAGQVKPVSGGGIYTGAICAKIAGEVAAKVIKEGNTSAERLTEYENRWRAAIGRELNVGMKINEVLGRLSDSDINELIGMINDPKILNIISKYGDMDYPSAVVKKLILTKPSLLKSFGLIVKAMG